MSRSKAISRRTADGAGMVVWGWYSVVAMAGDGTIVGGDKAGGEAAAEVKKAKKALATRATTTNAAFFAAWWTEDPRRVPDAPPDDFGIVLGTNAHAEAIGEADRVIRRARGRPCYAVSVGEHFASRAFRDGARRKVSDLETARADKRSALDAFGLDEATATIPMVRRAFRRRLDRDKLHPDQGGDAVRFNELVEQKKLAEEYVRLLEQDRAAGAFSRGEQAPAPPPKKKRKPKPKKATEEGDGATPEAAGAAP